MLASLDPDGGHGRVDLEPKADCSATPDSITVRKVWRNDAGMRRPTSVTVALLSDGEVADRVTLDDASGWAHTWTGLAGGHDYRVVETDVPDGYHVLVDREGDEMIVANTGTALADTGAWPSVYGWAVACLTVGVIILCLAHAGCRNGEGHGIQ